MAYASLGVRLRLGDAVRQTLDRFRWLPLVMAPLCLFCACSSVHSATGQGVSGHALLDRRQGARTARLLGEDEPAARVRKRIGRSVDGRSLWAYRRGDPDSVESILVVGCVHGDEPAGIAVAQLVIRSRPAGDANIWILPDLNPDGVAANTRQNARGVDLNRNFPYAWRRLGARGTRYYAGASPLSEPESRAVARLIERVRPQVSIWFHQPYGVVDQSGGDVRIERRFSRLIGLPIQRLPRYPGSITGWENRHLSDTTTAFVVELRPGEPETATVQHYADAVLDFADGM